MDPIEIIFDNIKKRKSSYPKEYNHKEITKDLINHILKLADTAPNHKKTKPWRFQIFKNDEKENLAFEIQKLYKNHTPENLFLEKKHQDFYHKIEKSNTLISISVNLSGLVPEWEEIAATAMAVQNMYLACTAYSIGCYWSTHAVTAHLNHYLGLEENQKCLGLFYMGYTD